MSGKQIMSWMDSGGRITSDRTDRFVGGALFGLCSVAFALQQEIVPAISSGVLALYLFGRAVWSRGTSDS